ncbi:aspartate-semialdehyde dehydrogenase [Clostridium botulinum]|uniref:Aspartate-semialdehyde dehydrogenase n=1 Tax=Clostridium botulinum C/D str. DC5 TaxID=1443128 RepID=A0A0A0IG58_CLOBO|nr:aspartate-semialdehyde dehydrogenase [Clostridium botulinum]KEI03490.1 aspartate-semialdehyde dehydrogenase [Clostridium botulinum C/D str. BKT75002]KEI08877.1 aspartate-semialdehyde dehydrogenase [Clostridium botulinum C/D str. BKT2873]KGM94327.1 aspartate-semialdehyde dehydrogenase [Clostridium botulinum D str. CCUG 7971]KGM99543.1 aspartate-semialdehyde dehydrogenase [Clostridium botulinum C/D str. DC5]KOC47609.1 aspartate-semialdehyde dehydrogenase [Clostridium botulinum]
MQYNIAVVGATGMVGNKFIEVLAERNFPIKNLYFFASKKSAGKILKFKDTDIIVEELKEDNIKNKKIDFALFSAGGSVSLEYAPIFAKYNAVVIDNSSAWRMNPEIPLVVPEVNPEDIKLHKGIIANPNCSTIQAVVALKPLYDKYGIKRVVYSTYQAVSGAGVGGFNDLQNGYNGEDPKKFPYPIAGNILPHIDDFLDNGYTKEEMKMINETRKIFHDDNLKITATTARVPVFYGHSESINVELEKPFEIDDIFNLYKNTDGVVLKDDVKNLVYPLPIDVEGHDEVYIGRIRRDFSLDNGLNLWVVADNIRKGAASNAIQIAEKIISMK